jgi:beta-glucuronidase
MFTYNRKSQDLNGVWKFNPDPYQRCRQQQWWKNLSSDKSFFPCWDIEGLWDIQVPGTWKTQFPELKWYDGHANYVKDFTARPVGDDEEAFLVFDGIVYAAEIYLNGHKVGQHDWGYSPFTCRVTEYLRPGNRLFVLVENNLSADRVPGIRFDWNNDGGIINGVKLIFVPRVFIENFRTSTRIDGEDAVITLDVYLQSRDTSATEQVTFAIPELEVRNVLQVQAGGKATAEVRVPLKKIRLWSPDEPKLYRTVLTTAHEQLTDDIGYREIRVAGREILLNGKPIRLHGVCVHSEFQETGRTATPHGIAEVVARARELGCNFLRCAHYPYAEIWGRAMDAAGLLWWEEVPVYWLPNVQQEHMSRLALGMLREMIQRDWNRASLIIWSVSNECAGDAGHSFDMAGGNYPYWTRACKLVRDLDDSRLLSSAECGQRRTLAAQWTPDAGDAFTADFGAQRWIPAHPDAFYELFDILAGNVYVTNVGEGLTAYHKFVDMLKRYNKPIAVSEFGSMSLRGSDAMAGVTADSLGSEARHVRVLGEAYQSFAQLPEIVGYMPWCLVDVRVPMHWRWYNAGQAVFRYGLLDEKWCEKKAFAAVKDGIASLRKMFDAKAERQSERQ